MERLKRKEGFKDMWERSSRLTARGRSGGVLFEKRKRECQRDSVCPYEFKEWEKDTEDGDRERWGGGRD